MTLGPAARPPGESYQMPPEPGNDEAKRQLYAAHRRRRHVPVSSIVVLVVLLVVFALFVTWFALHLL